MTGILGSILNDFDVGTSGLTKVISVASDFPTAEEVEANPTALYGIANNVTDNDPTKTNTGQSFVEGDVLFYDITDTKYVKTTAPSPTWGAIVGTISNQTDLVNYINNLLSTKENVANKENTTLDNNTTKYPTVNLVKTGLDLKQNILAEGAFVNGDKTKLNGIEANAEVNNISDADALSLTDGGDTTLHNHDSRYYTEVETDALLATKQDQDNLLDSISSLAGNGIIVRQNGNDAASRSITSDSGKISITNGDGISGNPSISAETLLSFRGNYDASSNTFPTASGSGTAGAILKGDYFRISVAGTLGSYSVSVGDYIMALIDTPGQTDSNWKAELGSSTIISAITSKLGNSLDYGKLFVGNSSNEATPSFISDLTAKATPIGNDILLIEDSEDAVGNKLKKILISSLPSSGGSSGSLFEDVYGIVDGTGGTTNHYATVKEAIVAGKSVIRVNANNTNVDITLSKSIQLIIDNGVVITFNRSTNNAPIITADFSINFIPLSKNAKVIFNPANSFKAIQKTNDNTGVYDGYLYFGEMIVDLSSVGALNTNLCTSHKLKMFGTHILVGNYQNAGIEAVEGSSLEDLLFTVQIDTELALITSGSYSKNIRFNLAGHGIGLLFSNGDRSTMEGVEVYGGGSYSFENGGHISNVKTNNSSPSVLNFYKVGEDDAIFENITEEISDLDFQGYSNYSVLNTKIDDVVVNNSGNGGNFINCQITGSATAICQNKTQIVNCEFNLLKIGLSSLGYAPSNIKIVNTEATTFTIEKIGGNLHISNCSDNIRNEVNVSSASSPYQVVGNELVIADASSGLVAITGLASPQNGQKLKVKAINNSTNSVSINANTSKTVESSGSQIYVLNENESVDLQYFSTGTIYRNI